MTPTLWSGGRGCYGKLIDFGHKMRGIKQHCIDLNESNSKHTTRPQFPSYFNKNAVLESNISCWNQLQETNKDFSWRTGYPLLPAMQEFISFRCTSRVQEQQNQVSGTDTELRFGVSVSETEPRGAPKAPADPIYV